MEEKKDGNRDVVFCINTSPTYQEKKRNCEQTNELVCISVEHTSVFIVCFESLPPEGNVVSTQYSSYFTLVWKSCF